MLLFGARPKVIRDADTVDATTGESLSKIDQDVGGEFPKAVT